MDNQVKNYKSQTAKSWFVIYTRARWEKKVDQLLKQKGITSYCPLTTVKNQWADRTKIVELPLFTSYLFVNINIRQELIIRQTYGVINFIYHMGKPATIRDNEIDRIRETLMSNPAIEIVSAQSLSAGDRVSIKNGLFCNQEGRVIQVSGKTVLMLFDELDCALVSRVPISNVTLINS